MTQKKTTEPFPHAGDDLVPAHEKIATPQTTSPSYRLAFADDDFLLTDELRGVRLMLEFLKPEIAMQEHHVESTVVVFGSTRLRPANESVSGDHKRLKLDRDYYSEAQQLGQLVSRRGQADHSLECVIMTGGGPGIMEAANLGADDVGAKSIGLNIVLPREQVPNRFMTPELTFQFHYFALRKLHFLLRAKALVVFPGGFGTLDELFDALTLLQTKRIKPMPVLLFGRSFWDRIIDFDAMVELGVIDEKDIELFRFVETAAEACEFIFGSCA